MGRKKKSSEKYVDELLEQAIKDNRPIWPPMSDKGAIIRFIGYIPSKPKKYVLQTRYEYWSANGKEWCKWFYLCEGDSEKELKDRIKEYKENSVNKKVHLKDDYQIIENPKYEETEN